MADDFDRKAAAFHRSWQRRNAIAFAVLGTMLLLGAAAATVFIAVGIYDDPTHHIPANIGRGIGGLVFAFGGGVLCLRMAVRVLRGKVEDPDAELRREIGS
jgi:hypothetical protein